jgi:hypothetical protein
VPNGLRLLLRIVNGTETDLTPLHSDSSCLWRQIDKTHENQRHMQRMNPVQNQSASSGMPRKGTSKALKPNDRMVENTATARNVQVKNGPSRPSGNNIIAKV